MALEKRCVLALARSHAGEVHTSARSSDCRPPWYWRPPSPPDMEVDCEGAARLPGRAKDDTWAPRRARPLSCRLRSQRPRLEPCQWQPRSKFFVLPQALYERAWNQSFTLGPIAGCILALDSDGMPPHSLIACTITCLEGSSGVHGNVCPARCG